MERVQFQQEQMLAELKDLEQKGLFSQTEIKSIMKKRTAFESALIRRIPQKSDFLRYAAYEMGLEALRRRRVKRLNLPPGAPSISDFALVRRQFHIFERALRKFKTDVGLWVQYIELAKREGARALVGRISARALQLHPNEVSLYVFAAQHELENLSPAAARALLQRGIRLNKENVPLWTEYVKFELGFVEGLRRRWDVLGVQDGGEGGGEEAMEDASEEARKEIMQGGIVKAVITEAAKAIPQLPLFQALHALISTYPTPIRPVLLEHMHELLVLTLPSDPAALRLHAARFLPASGVPEETEAFVDHLRDANEELLEKARMHCKAVSAAYAEFVEEWCQKDIDSNLRLYLIACLQSLMPLPEIAPHALAVHLRLLSSDVHPSPPLGTKVVQRARKYTGRAPTSAEVWLARLDVEAKARGGVDEEVRRAWAEARGRVQGEGMEEVWLWGLQDLGEDARGVCEVLLRESTAASSRSLHTRLLTHYLTEILHPPGCAPPPPMRLSNTRHILSTYLASPVFLRAAFTHEAGLDDAAESVLEAVYEEWRRRDGEEVEASVTWGEWLLGRGEGARAAETVAGVKGAEERWREVLDGER